MKSRIQEVFLKQKSHQLQIGKTTAKERIQKLVRLKEKLLSRTKDLHAAIYQDYRKSAVEVDISEVYPTVAEIDFAIRNLKKWMKPIRVKNPFLMTTSRSQLHYEAKGVVLIIGPWNYPSSLVLVPLVSAIAAGNCAILKPSELTENTSRFLRDLISDCFPEEEVSLFEGGPEVAQELLQIPFDHIFFTGSTRVGRIVMEAAAKNLTPVTLELGGKSPVLLDETAELEATARRIVWGKYFNAGQTCVAPDYVLVPENRAKDFLNFAKKSMASIYGATEELREKSPDFCRIINHSHYERLKKLTHETVQQGAKVEMGGIFKDAQRYASPTLLSNVKPEHPIMEDEIFGPVLPVITYRSIEDTYQLIQAKQKPLALYIFSRNQKQIQSILKNTTAGGTCINATLIHLANPHLPFGGIGKSGIGNYHGYFGFKTFSHERAVLTQGLLDAIRLLYPPYGKSQKQLANLSIRYLTR